MAKTNQFGYTDAEWQRMVEEERRRLQEQWAAANAQVQTRPAVVQKDVGPYFAEGWQGQVAPGASGDQIAQGLEAAYHDEQLRQQAAANIAAALQQRHQDRARFEPFATRPPLPFTPEPVVVNPTRDSGNPETWAAYKGKEGLAQAMANAKTGWDLDVTAKKDIAARRAAQPPRTPTEYELSKAERKRNRIQQARFRAMARMGINPYAFEAQMDKFHPVGQPAAPANPMGPPDVEGMLQRASGAGMSPQVAAAMAMAAAQNFKQQSMNNMLNQQMAKFGDKATPPGWMPNPVAATPAETAVTTTIPAPVENVVNAVAASPAPDHAARTIVEKEKGNPAAVITKLTKDEWYKLYEDEKKKTGGMWAWAFGNAAAVKRLNAIAVLAKHAHPDIVLPLITPRQSAVAAGSRALWDPLTSGGVDQYGKNLTAALYDSLGIPQPGPATYSENPLWDMAAAVNKAGADTTQWAKSLLSQHRAKNKQPRPTKK